MKNEVVVFTSILLLLVTVFGSAEFLAPAQASSTGLVCIIPSSATSCPSTPASITGTVGSQLRVSVFLQNSSGINGFDITLLANRTILRPTAVDLTGSVLLGTPTIIVECLSGVLVTGSVCPLSDNINTIELAAASALGSGITSTPTTGLLFTAIYNVTGITSGTGLSFQTGCSNTSVSPNVCVTMANGAPVPVPETIQTAIFSSSTTPDFLISANPSSLTIATSSSGASTLTLSSSNGFTGTINLAASISPSGPAVSLSASSIALSAGGSGTSALTVSTTSLTSSGPYSLTVLGTSGSISHSITLSVIVFSNQPDFAIAANPSSLTFLAGSTATSTISISAVNGFNGTVVFTVTASSGLTGSMSPNSVGPNGKATLTVTASLVGTFSATVTGTSGSLSHSATVSVTVTSNTPDFTITANPTGLSLAVGMSGTSAVTLQGFNGFNSTILLSVSASNGLAATISPSSTGPFGTATLTVTSNTPGSYTAQITGTSGTLSHTTKITVMISSSGIGVVCIIPSGTSPCPSSPAFITGTQGTQLRVSVFIQGSGALSGFDITLLADHTILRPAAIDLTGTVLPAPTTIVSECLGGIIVLGPRCSGTADTLELAAVGAPSQVTFPPTTGLLFTAIYNVTGTTSGLTIGYETGCTSTSVMGTSTCVAIANGSTSPVPETVETAIFSTSTTPDFLVTSSPSNITITAGSSGTSLLSITSTNGFSGTVSLNATVVTGNLTININPPIVTIGAGQTSTSTITISSSKSTPPGTYTTTIAALSGSMFHSVAVPVTVNASPKPDFSITANPSVVTAVQGSSATSSLTLLSLNGFNGTVNLSASISSATLTASLTPTSVTLPGAPLFVGGWNSLRQNAGSGTTTQSVTICNLSGGCRAGDTIIVNYWQCCTTGQSLSSITDTEGNTYTEIVLANGANGNFVMADMWGVVSIKADTASLTITATYPDTTHYRAIFVQQYRNVLGIGATHFTGQSSCSSTSETLTTTRAGSLVANSFVIGFMTGMSQTGGLSASNDFSYTNSAGWGLFLWDSPVPNIGSNTWTWNVSGCNSTYQSVAIELVGGSVSSTLTISTTSTTPTGIYTLTVTGSSGSIARSTSITVTVTAVTSGDFTISESPTFQAIPVASERQTIITLTSVNGFSGNVNLVISPSSKAFACWFTTLNNTATVFVPAGGSANQFPTCGAGRPAGAYNATISGTSGSLSHAIILGVTITDFSMTASSVSFASGSSGIGTVTITSLFGLSGPISLSVSTSSGLTGTCLSSVTLSSGGTSTASCTFSSTTPGSYGATITGTFVCSDCYFNGQDIHTANITVTVSGTGVPDFSISAAPSSLTIPPGSSGSSTITVTSINGFSGTVSLSVTHSSGVGAVVSPTSIIGSGTATLTIGANATGTFSVQITGASGTLSHSVSISVTVTTIGVICVIASGNTSCPSSPASFTGAAGTPLRVSIFVQGSAGLNGFDVTLLADHTILRPVGIDLTGTVLIGTPTIVVECLQGVLIQGSVCSSTDTINTLQIVATSALGSGITATPTTGLLFTATYNITGVTPGITFGFQNGCSNTSVSGGVCVTVANGTPIPVPETVQTATFSNSAASPDFSITPSPSSLTTLAGTCATSTVTLASSNGFSGTITLTISVSPTGPTATLSSSNVSITSGASATTALAVCTAVSTPPGSYTVRVTATSGSLSHATTVAVTVIATPNFTIAATPTSQTIRRSSSAIFIITITGTNGFNGTVHLTTTISPTVKNGPILSLPATVGPNSNSTLTASTTHSTPVGTYTITVTATSGSITHTITVKVTVTK